MTMSKSNCNSSSSGVSITARFTLPCTSIAVTNEGKHEHSCGSDSAVRESTASTPVVFEQRFDETNCEMTLIGLPPGIDPNKPEPGNYQYSGMHDHGPMQPPPKEGGDFGLLVSLALEARRQSDLLLTRIIEEDKAKDKIKDMKYMQTSDSSSVRKGRQQHKPQNIHGSSTNSSVGQLLKKVKVATVHDSNSNADA